MAKRITKMARKIFIILSILVILYLGIGLAFHFTWQSALAACREARRAQGEFVEPEVLGGIIGFVFDVTYWPVYSWANINLDGVLFATPCTHSDKEWLVDSLSLEKSAPDCSPEPTLPAHVLTLVRC